MWHAVTAFLGLVLLALYFGLIGLAVIPVTVHIEFTVPVSFILWTIGIAIYGMFWILMLYKSSIWLMETKERLKETEVAEN
jgi:hypothetical protein